MKFDFSHISRDFLMKRTKALEPWYFRMSVLTVLLAIVMGVALSFCQKLSLMFGVEMGLLCAIPMLFILLLPFFLAQFFVEVLRFSELHVSAPDAFFNNYHSFIHSIFLPVPLSPPRFRLA